MSTTPESESPDVDMKLVFEDIIRTELLTDEEIEDISSPDPEAARVTYTTTDFDVDGLVRRMQRGDIIIPTFGETHDSNWRIETQPFQRPFVWNKPQMDKFIESLLLGYPIPGIFLVQQSNRQYLVLDGQQRLRTLRAFKEGMVNKKMFSLTSVAEQFEDLTFETLSPEQRRQVDDTFIQATIVQSTGLEDSLDAIYQVFERLNTGGTQLRPHEIRVALYSGELVTWITTLAQREEWRRLYGASPAHLRDQELILRIVSLDTEPNNYKRPLKKFLNDFCRDHREMQGIDKASFESRFVKAAELIYQSDPYALRLSGNAVNAAWSEALFVGVMSILRGHSITSTEVTIGLASLRQNQEMLQATTRATSDDDSVKSRISLSTKAFA